MNCCRLGDRRFVSGMGRDFLTSPFHLLRDSPPPALLFIVAWKACLWVVRLTRTSQIYLCQLKNERPTWCHLLFYFTSYVLNVFRTLIYPSSGTCDSVVELPHRSSCSQFVVCWRFCATGFEWCSFCRLKHNCCASACKTNTNQKPVAPNLQHTTNWEKDDRCGNSTTQSQAPDDGYINFRNMLST